MRGEREREIGEKRERERREREERERERERWCFVFGGTLEEIIDECAPQASSLRIIIC